MENGYHIWIDSSANHFGVDIRIGLFRDGKRQIAVPVELSFCDVKHGEVVPPTMQFNTYDGMDFLNALKLALNEHRGIREGHVEGELTATKGHLRDLKTILWDQMGINKGGKS